MKTNILKTLRDTVIFAAGLALLDWCFYKEVRFDDTCISIIGAYFAYELVRRIREEKKYNKKSEFDFVVAVECADNAEADQVSQKLMSNGINAMVVDKDCPIFIKDKGSNSPAQVQVLRKDLETAKGILK